MRGVAFRGNGDHVFTKPFGDAAISFDLLVFFIKIHTVNAGQNPMNSLKSERRFIMIWGYLRKKSSLEGVHDAHTLMITIITTVDLETQFRLHGNLK